MVCRACKVKRMATLTFSVLTSIDATSKTLTAVSTGALLIAALIHKHAEMSGFPANKVTEIAKKIDPTTGE